MENQQTRLIDQLRPSLEKIDGIAIRQITYFENKVETIKIKANADQDFPYVFIMHDFKTNDLKADFREEQFVGATHSYPLGNGKQLENLKNEVAFFFASKSK